MHSPPHAHSDRTFYRTFWLVLALLLIPQGFWLWSHESTNPAGILPYSRTYLLVLIAHASLTCLAGIIAMAPDSAVSLHLRAIVMSRPWVRLRFVFMVSIWLLWCAWNARSAGTALARSGAFFLLTAAVCYWLSFGVVISTHAPRGVAFRKGARFISISASAICAIIVCEVFLHTNPGVMPTELIPQLPGGGEFLRPHYVYDKPVVRGYWFIPGKQVTSVLTESLASLYVQQPEVMRPPQRDNVLREATFLPDENGYRNTMPLRERYDIVVGGDSFAAVSFEPRPWPILLSEMLGREVFNLGMQGYGPQAMVQTVRILGLPKQPVAAIIGYYEGNDLIDACLYEAKAASGLNWAEHDVAQSPVLDRLLVWRVLKHMITDLIPRGDSEVKDDPPFPFECKFNGATVELGFALHQLSRLAMTREHIDSACGFGPMIKQIVALHHESRAAGIKLIIAYCPTKESCYVPLLPRQVLQEKASLASPPIVVNGRVLQDGDRRLEVDALLGNVDTFRHYLMEVLRSKGVHVMDLTPGFREAAAKGSILYYANDSHWCPQGHELAAKLIADHLRETTGL